MSERRSGGRIVVDGLLAHGVRRVFCVPGESYLAVLDALWDERGRIDVVACRHEHGAAMMAEAHAKLTSEVGVCLVTRGPGACNAAIGVHTAMQDETPLLLLVGQVQSAALGREAFQEVDLAAMFRPLAKDARQVEDARDLPVAIADAMHTARSGRPGPVVLALPEDVLTTIAEVDDRPVRSVAAEPPDPGAMERLHRILDDAARPVLLVGGGGWTDDARADLRAFVEANALPTCGAFRRLDILDQASPCWTGELGIGADPALVARVRGADVLIAVGTRLDEPTTQGDRLFAPGGPDLVHVHPEPTVPGRVVPPILGIVASAGDFARAAQRLPAFAPRHRRDWREEARRGFLADTTPAPTGTDLDPGRAMLWLRERLPADAVVTVDAGNFSGWPQRYLRFGGGRRLLGACNGAMGYGVPAAIAAALARPAGLVVACVGDGGFGMTGAELATAARHDAKLVVLVFDNGQYGTIRMHQERAYPGRPVATALANPDFAAIARAHGLHGETVARTEDFAPAFERAVVSGRAAVLHLHLDPDLISTRTTLTSLHDAAGEQ